MARPRSTGEDVEVDADRYKPIPGYTGYYAGIDGEIYSTKTARTLRQLKPWTTGDEDHLYKMVSPVVDGRVVKVSTHVLVTIAFHGPRPFVGAESRHLDGISLNTVPTNLCWGTAEQNQADRLIHGTSNRGTNNGHAKFTTMQVCTIVTDPRNSSRLAKALGVSATAIQDIRKGRRWGWLTGIGQNTP